MARAGRRFLLKPNRPIYRRTVATTTPTTGLASIGVASSSAAWMLITTGLSSVGVDSSSATASTATTTGTSPVAVGTSGTTGALTTTGLAPIEVGSGSHTLRPGELEGYTGEPHDVLIKALLTGRLQPILPEPTPPVDFDGLPDPTVAPVAVASNTAGGHLPDGTYRYAYAAWSGDEGQATGPSPWSNAVTLTTDDTVTLTYAAIDGADGYLVYREAAT